MKARAAFAAATAAAVLVVVPVAVMAGGGDQTISGQMIDFHKGTPGSGHKGPNKTICEVWNGTIVAKDGRKLNFSVPGPELMKDSYLEDTIYVLSLDPAAVNLGYARSKSQKPQVTVSYKDNGKTHCGDRLANVITKASANGPSAG